MRLLCTLFSLLLLLASCCGPRVDVNVKSICQKDGRQLTCYHFEELPEEHQRNYVQHYEEALLMRGWKKAEKKEDATVAILPKYEISGPTYVIINGVESPTASEEAMEALKTNPEPSKAKKLHSLSPPNPFTPLTVHAIYTHRFTLTGFDAKRYYGSGEQKELWKLTTSCLCNTDEKRRVFPLLIAASKDCIGSNIPEPISISFAEDDPIAVEIRATLD